MTTVDLEYLRARVFLDAVQPRGNVLPVPNGPGIGMCVDRDYLDETAVVA